MGALEVDSNMLLVHLYYSPQAYLIFHVHTHLGPKKFLDNIQVATFTGPHQGGSSSWLHMGDSKSDIVIHVTTWKFHCKFSTPIIENKEWTFEISIQNKIIDSAYYILLVLTQCCVSMSQNSIVL